MSPSDPRPAPEALAEQLDAYRTARPTTPAGRPHWSHYAAAAGSALALASGAEAAIVYSGALDTPVAFTNLNQYTLDLDGDSIDDLTVDFDVAGGYLRANAIAFDLAVDGFGTFGTQARLFAASQTLDAAANLRTQGWLFVQSTGAGSVDGPWALGAAGFAGLFTSGGLPAWVRLAFNDAAGSDGLADEMRVVDWAYDNGPGAERIHIGDGIPAPAPAPAPLALLALGAAGLAATRRVGRRRAS